METEKPDVPNGQLQGRETNQIKSNRIEAKVSKYSQFSMKGNSEAEVHSFFLIRTMFIRTLRLRFAKI